MRVVCEIPAFENVSPSKTSKSVSWVLLGAGEEGGVLVWYGFWGDSRYLSGFSFWVFFH